MLAACAGDPMVPVREAFYRGDYGSARDQLAALAVADPDNAHLYRLELGAVQQALGDPRAAVAALRQGRDGLDAHAKDTSMDWLAAVVLDDRSRAFPGADYEQVLVRAMLAANDLMAGGHDAYAYALQVLERQKEIIRAFDPGDRPSPKEKYALVAFGNYVRGIINEENARDRSEAVREFGRVKERAPGFEFADADLARAQNGQYAAPDHGVVHVLAMVGLAPLRVQVEERATRDALAIAQLFWSAHEKRPFVPIVVPLPLPALAFSTDNPDAVAVLADGRIVRETAVLTDVEAMARTEFAVMRPWVMARAVIRRLIKTAVMNVGQEVVERKTTNTQKRRGHDDLLQIGVGVLGNLWAATEKADLRCWSFLPATIQVLRVELPEGEHEITLRATRHGAQVGAPQTVRVRVLTGYNTYVLGLTPTINGGPQPLASRMP